MDGSSLVTACAEGVDVLVEDHGFKKAHARTLIRALKERTGTASGAGDDDAAAAYPCYLPLTAKEGERMMKFAEAYEMIRVCTERAQIASEKLKRERVQILQKVEKNFMAVLRKLENEKARIYQTVEKEYGGIVKRLSGVKEQLEGSMDTAKKTERDLNKQSRITDWSEQKAREELILQKSADVLRTVHPFLADLPSLDISFDDYIFSKILDHGEDQEDQDKDQEEEEGDGKEGEGFHICTLNVKQPVLEGKSVMKSEKAKREEEEKKEKERKKKEKEEEERKKKKRMEEEEKKADTAQSSNLHKISTTCTETLTGHSSDVRSVAVSRDGQTVVSGSSDNTIKVWDIKSGSCTKTLTAHSDHVQQRRKIRNRRRQRWSVAISRDGQTVVSGSSDKTIKIWR